MNKQELIKEFRKIGIYNLSIFGTEIKGIPTESAVTLIEQLDEPQPLKLKDIISRMKQLFPLSRSEWIDEILHEFGEGFGSIKYREGFEQGKLEGAWVGNQLKDADKIRQELNKPVVPQFVADWDEKNKDDFEFNVWDWSAFRDEPEKLENKEFNDWINDGEGTPIQTLVNMHQFGYEVKEEPKYIVKVKEIAKYRNYLVFGEISRTWFFASVGSNYVIFKHTRKELEEAGFGWVFDCPGIEIEEATE